METINAINQVLKIILFVIGAVTFYQIILIFVGFFGKGRKFKATDKQYNYAVLIAARNEEATLGPLIESIKKQDYPADKITIFVVADNCHDRTAEIAREMGCVVYERHNPPKKQRRKSYVLKMVLEKIAEEYENGIMHFDGYFVFDADNLLATNYVTEMNKAFDNKKYDYITSYLSEKNLETKIIPTFSSIGLGGLYSADMTQHRSSSVLGFAPMICGKGFLLRSEIVKDGWKWLGLTEDIELRAELQARGKRGCWVESAECFDENPHTMRMLLRQRMRWERGSIVAFCKHGFMNLVGIFWPRDWSRRTKEEKAKDYKPKGFWPRIADGLQRRFSCYNQLWLLMPRPLIYLTLGFLYPLIVGIITISMGDMHGLVFCLLVVLGFYGVMYLSEILTYSTVIFRERTRIRGELSKMVKYIFIWPFFTILIQYVSCASIFVPIKWKPIPHLTSVRIEEINEAKTFASHEDNG